MNSIVCTLFEGAHHHGLGALANSLYRHGFNGLIWAGYRGALPPWAKPLKKGRGFAELSVAGNYCIRFVKLSTETHLANYKPDFMLDVINRCENADMLFYFDTDVIVKNPWEKFEEWASRGIALCSCLEGIHSSHPRRLAWKEFAEKHGFRCKNDLSCYVSSGFIGVARKHYPVIREWKRLMEAIEKSGKDLTRFASQNPADPLQFFDEVALNIAAMVTSHPLSITGLEGMGFTAIPGWQFMSHARGKPKPWEKQMTLSALRGSPPSLAEKDYWDNAQEPIRLHSPLLVKLKKLDIKLGSAVGRVIKRA